jgi:glycosyltransferase involved in cell wall biosynthesis
VRSWTAGFGRDRVGGAAAAPGEATSVRGCEAGRSQAPVVGDASGEATRAAQAPALDTATRAGPADRLPIGILVIARDEEANLPDCMHSVVGWAEQVVVVLDPRTRDRSREVAAGAGAEVVEHPFETHARQRNWALDQHSWRTPWILVVDADERISPELVEELRAIVSSPQAFATYAVRKRFIFYGKWMRHCWYSAWDLRLFRLGSARYEERPVHEHMIAEGRVGYLRADLIHNDFKDMDSWIDKHNRYATFEASEMNREAGENRVRGRLFGSWTERRRYIKDVIWNRLPFRPLFWFLYLYVWKLGFLDGRLGLRFCLMHGIFDAFVTAKAWERRFLGASPPPNYYRREVADYLRRNPETAARYPSLGAD